MLKHQYFTLERGPFCLLTDVIFAIWGKLIFFPSSCPERFLSSFQHNSLFINYQYKNIFRLAIRVQLEIIIFLPFAVASQKNGVVALQEGQ